MDIHHRRLFSPILILLLLASFVVIFITLPSNLMRFIVDLKPPFSISPQNLRTKVSGEDDFLLAVEHAGHSNSTVTVISMLAKFNHFNFNYGSISNLFLDTLIVDYVRVRID